MKPIIEIAEKLGLRDDEVEQYGKYKAKISLNAMKRLSDRPDGKLILVTATNPTPAGEGKTTVTVGLGQAMGVLGKNACIALREPSLGPVMGIKGGAAGGGYSQVVPMEDINLHFTGDIHAVTAAHNLLSSIIDNHIHHDNELLIDPRTIVFKRVMDLNDRSLRNIITGLGGKSYGIPREDGFMITAASEIMAILCLADNIEDLKCRLSNIIIGRNYNDQPLTVEDLGVAGAMAALLKDAVKPNLVQTLEGTPCFIHGGPFANIAHGCNSITATRLALKLCDYVITEAGFGADLGAEKFFDIKCRTQNLTPSAVVIVTTVKALKYNGAPVGELSAPDTGAVARGLENLQTHIENMQKFGPTVFVAINKFATDTDEEINLIKECCAKNGVIADICEVFEKGGAGGVGLARKLIEAAEQPVKLKPLYELDLDIKAKVEKIVKEIYRGAAVKYSPEANRAIVKIEADHHTDLPICMAKTQYSLSSDAAKLGAPRGFTFNVSDVKLSNGAGFIVVFGGNIMTMPGLPRVPSANMIDIDNEGNISGLF